MEAEGLLERRRGIGLFIAEIHSDKKDQTKEDIIKAIMSKAVTTAIQFELSQEKTEKILKDLFLKFRKEIREKSND